WPAQPAATSNVRRPVSMAPTSAIKALRWSALGAETWNVMSDLVLGMEMSTSPEKYQSKTSATPSFASATYPSRDIDMSATTLLLIWCSFARGAGVLLSSQPPQGRVNHRSTPRGHPSPHRGPACTLCNLSGRLVATLPPSPVGRGAGGEGGRTFGGEGHGGQPPGR